MIADNKHWCNFCGKSQDEVNAMVSGMNNSDICDSCVLRCVGTLILKDGNKLNESANIPDSASHQ
ncbi:ClpX C4-type zinc finger protein [Photorhabdus sp. RM323S]|uniref:ClpX C4-type zinc finger protein n=1 Tax=Photorhabdus sp. RM323S TaxID=3342828 RepID=UPI0036DA8E46